MSTTISDHWIKDLSKLLKEEGSFVKDLAEIATKGAEFQKKGCGNPNVNLMTLGKPHPFFYCCSL